MNFNLSFEDPGSDDEITREFINGELFSSDSDSGSLGGSPNRLRLPAATVFDAPEPPKTNFPAPPPMQFDNAAQLRLARTSVVGLSFEELVASVVADKFAAIEARFTSMNMLSACTDQRLAQLEGGRPQVGRPDSALAARVQALEDAFAGRIRHDDSALLARLEILERAQRADSARLQEFEARLREKALTVHLEALKRDLRGEAVQQEAAVAARVVALEARRQEDLKLYDRIKFLEEFSSRPSSPTGVAQLEEVDFSKYATKKDLFQAESRLGCRVEELQAQISTAFPQKKNRNF
jgi:hypothetical protein